MLAVANCVEFVILSVFKIAVGRHLDLRIHTEASPLHRSTLPFRARHGNGAVDAPLAALAACHRMRKLRVAIQE